MFTVTKYSSVDDANDSYVQDEQLCVYLVFMTGETYEIKTNLASARLFEFSRAVKTHLVGVTPIIMFKYLWFDTDIEAAYDQELRPIENDNGGTFRRFVLNVFITTEEENLGKLNSLHTNGLNITFYRSHYIGGIYDNKTRASTLFDDLNHYYCENINNHNQYTCSIQPSNAGNQDNDNGIDFRLAESMAFHLKFFTEASFFKNIRFFPGRGIDSIRYLGSILSNVDNMSIIDFDISPTSAIQHQDGGFYTERFINGIRRQTNLRTVSVTLNIGYIMSLEINEIEQCISRYINMIGQAIRGLTSIDEIHIRITNECMFDIENINVNEDDVMQVQHQLRQNGCDLSGFASALLECSNLTTIRLDNLVFNNHSLEILNNTLTAESVIDRLHKLKLVSCIPTNVDNTLIPAFTNAISGLKNMVSLKLASVKMDDESASTLFNILKDNDNIIDIVLNNCNIGITFTNEHDNEHNNVNGYIQHHKAIDNLCEQLSNKKCHLHILDLSNNPIWSEGLTKIAECMHTNVSLRSLKLNNSLGFISHSNTKDLDVDHMMNFSATSEFNSVLCSTEQEQANIERHGYTPCIAGIKSIINVLEDTSVQHQLKSINICCHDSVSSQCNQTNLVHRTQNVGDGDVECVYDTVIGSTLLISSVDIQSMLASNSVSNEEPPRKKRV